MPHTRAFGAPLRSLAAPQGLASGAQAVRDFLGWQAQPAPKPEAEAPTQPPALALAA